MEFLIISGMSGAGKSQAADILEDMDYYCVDNLPLALLGRFAELLREVNKKVNLLSRKDTDALEYRHIAFCAAITKFFKPAAGARIADVGTGGGLPGDRHRAV